MSQVTRCVTHVTAVSPRTIPGRSQDVSPTPCIRKAIIRSKIRFEQSSSVRFHWICYRHEHPSLQWLPVTGLRRGHRYPGAGLARPHANRRSGPDREEMSLQQGQQGLDAGGSLHEFGVTRYPDESEGGYRGKIK